MNIVKKIKDKLVYLPLTIGGYSYPVPNNLPKPSGINSFINFALNVLIVVGFLAGVIFLILGALKWITSGGDKAKVEEAKGTITYSIVGLLVIVFSLFIIRVIGQVIGSPTLQFIFPPRTSCPSYEVCSAPPTPTPIPCTNPSGFC